jgi:hypothetical protein
MCVSHTGWLTARRKSFGQSSESTIIAAQPTSPHANKSQTPPKSQDMTEMAPVVPVILCTAVRYLNSREIPSLETEQT